MNETMAMIRRLVVDAQTFLGEALATRTSDRGQALIEVAMIVGFVAILAMSLITALGDVTGGVLSEVSHVFGGASEEQTALPNDLYRAPRIAD